MIPVAQPPPAEASPTAKFIEARVGFANYYFNKLEQQRVWKAWAKRAGFKGMDGRWTLTGEVEGGKPFVLDLTATDGRLKVGDTEVKWAASDRLNSSLLPEGSNGLMPALYLWRRLALEGLTGSGPGRIPGGRAAARSRRVGRCVGRIARRGRMQVLFRSGARATYWPWRCIRTRTATIRARSTSRDITRWTAARCRRGWKSAARSEKGKTIGPLEGTFKLDHLTYEKSEKK